jgi:broad specificity phosphatase PhoE
MQLIFIRHYKTLFNASGQLIGWGDSPRVDDWLDDMVFVEAELQRHVQHIDAIYSSALGRARETAKHFAGQLGVTRLEVAAELNEVNYGALSAKPKHWVEQHIPQHKNDAGFVYPDGESFNQMRGRCVEFVQTLPRLLPGETVLCVLHAGVIRALVSHFLELDYAAQLKRRVCHRYIGVLTFNGTECTGYEEWGMPSGFLEAARLPQPNLHTRG